MLDYNEIKPRKYIVFKGEPFEVVDSHVFRKQQRKPVNATKLRNLITGKVVENSFHQSDKVEEAEIVSRKVKYLYKNKGEIWLSDLDNPKDRFSIEEELAGPAINFAKENSEVEILSFDNEIISFKIPIKTELEVKVAPPAVKGNTAQGGVKQITLETGAVVNAPLFINEGDIVRINTETGEYVERVS